MNTPSINWAIAIPRFLMDAESILADERTRLVTFPDLYFGLAYLGGGHLFLGHAIQAWASGVLCRPCPTCKQPAYIIRASGSPLSGSGGWVGVCTQCGPIYSSQGVSDLVRHPQVMGHWAGLGYQPVLQSASPWTFSFTEGAVQQGDKVEIRLDVPGWREFILGYQPQFIIKAEPDAVAENQINRFGLTIRGKSFTIPPHELQSPRSQPS